MQPAAIHPDLQDRSVLISGGGSGIGAALTEGFVAQGARVAFIDRAVEPSEALCERLSDGARHAPRFIKADLRDIAALRAAAAEAAELNGPVTVLVNNAARDDRHRIEDVTEEYWDDNQATNLRHHFFLVQAVVPGMKAAGEGSIVNFSSISYMLNQGGMPSYTTAKGGVVGLTKGLAGELGPFGIRVNAVAPGWVMTERQKELWVTEEALSEMLDRQCLPRPLEPADMVGPCLFLASSAARGVTAQVLVADGGTQ
ncbi:SDR family NAD(P)-dependent oxidoreductase [Pararhizobium mangrovi]|uniref:SDR family oxidoreductase n=1 Tax=Pararhizobium mangrovi TaxID=2590452 RepID=A0A506U1S0_9HYPH|nr:SDR family oxidoreductase [Pararhizobium mangrovi]TPW27408.1 SDR family oxidoreductase [Pararhizobium mangrovi]